MSACEHCWGMARLMGIHYHDQLARAEREHATCTQDNIDGARLRAGQWWDEEKQRDSRSTDIGSADR